MRTGLSSEIEKTPPGGVWVAPRTVPHASIERAAAIAERRSGRLFKVIKRHDDWTVEDVTTHPGVRAARRNAYGVSAVSGSVRGVLSRSVVAELGGEAACRALVQKFLRGGNAA